MVEVYKFKFMRIFLNEENKENQSRITKKNIKNKKNFREKKNWFFLRRHKKKFTIRRKLTRRTSSTKKLFHLFFISPCNLCV